MGFEAIKKVYQLHYFLQTNAGATEYEQNSVLCCLSFIAYVVHNLASAGPFI